MAIRRRTWEWKGKEKSAWVIEYFDLKGKRRLKTCRTKHEAQDFEATTRIDIKRGVHVSDSDSITVAEAGKLWLQAGQEAGLVRASLKQCREHLDLHIAPFVGATKLSKLAVPGVRAFEGQLRANRRSPALTRKVLGSLGAIIADAQERGLAMHNPVREMRANRGKRRTKATRERRRQLAIGADIPLRQERLGPSWRLLRASGGHSLPRPLFPACEHPSCAGSAGGISTSPRPRLACGSGPMRGAPSTCQRAMPAIERSQCPRWS